MAECHDCGLGYHKWPDYTVDNGLWAELSPNGDSSGLLCLNCLANRFGQKYGRAGASDAPSYPLIAYVGGVVMTPSEVAQIETTN